MRESGGMKREGKRGGGGGGGGRDIGKEREIVRK